MKNMKTYYITTAIPYANGKPHIGTAMDYLYGDILLRHHAAGETGALMSIGTDEHGTKVEKKARELGKTPQQLVDDLQSDFDEMRTKLNLDFANIVNVRTTDADHVRRVQEIWRRLDAAGVIYKSTYEGWYCVGCESFLTETEAREMNYECADHQKPLEKLSEDNYYLKVSKFTEQIREFAKTSIVPEFRGKEILELIKNGAKDVSISRPKEKLSWGVPVPGDDSQTMYVWMDALCNYITVIGYPDDEKYRDFWPADVEIVGKDILRFHAVIWLAILLTLELPLPKKLLAHGHVTVSGAKMSKSVGNVVDPIEIIDNYGTDAFRYYFARHIPTFDDGDFTWEKFEAAYNGELANDLGNLVSRVANMLKKYEIARQFDEGTDLSDDAKKIVDNWNENFAELDLANAMENAWKLVQMANQFIDESKPWEVAKTDAEKLAEIMNRIWVIMMFINGLIRPFLPDTSDKMTEIFAKSQGEKITGPIPILFPKKYLHTEEPAKNSKSKG